MIHFSPTLWFPPNQNDSFSPTLWFFPQITTLGKTLPDLTSLTFVSNAALVKNYQIKQSATQPTMHGDNKSSSSNIWAPPWWSEQFQKDQATAKKIQREIAYTWGQKSYEITVLVHCSPLQQLTNDFDSNNLVSLVFASLLKP